MPAEGSPCAPIACAGRDRRWPAGACDAAPRWTFCVAASKSGDEVWITGVFAAERGRDELEGLFKALVERAGASADAQCPLPREDKTEAVNAQFEAEEFNRKLGATLHAVFAGEFLLRPR